MMMTKAKAHWNKKVGELAFMKANKSCMDCRFLKTVQQGRCGYSHEQCQLHPEVNYEGEYMWSSDFFCDDWVDANLET